MLTIVGSGSERIKLEDMCKRLNICDQIIFRGSVDNHLIPELLKEHGILTLSSYSEASPTVVKEALSMGRCVVSTNVGDVANWICQNKNGYITSEDNIDSFTRGILKCSEIIVENKYEYSSPISECQPENIFKKVFNIYVEKQ